MFTLFNLQGALGDFHRFSLSRHRSKELGDSLFILAHLNSFVKHFFLLFFKKFEVFDIRFSVFRASLEAACT